MAALRSRARIRGLQLPADEALKRQLSRWENGQVEPGELYQDLFCEAYGRAAAELGFSPTVSAADVPSELLSQLALARTAGPATVTGFAEQVEAVRTIDRRRGAPAALCQLRAITSSIESVLTHSLIPSVREPLATVLADAATLAGWQALDLGNVDEAWRWHELAKTAAREAGDIAGLSHAMGQQSCLLVDIGQAVDAVELAHAASETGGKRVPPVLTTWLAATEAEACAAAGDHYGMRRALDAAAAALPTRRDDVSQLPYIALDEAHLSRWRGSTLARIGDVEATEHLLDAAEIMDGTFVRAWASLECDLAVAFLARGDRAEARRHAQSARQLAKVTGSVRQRRRVEALGLAA